MRTLTNYYTAAEREGIGAQTACAHQGTCLGTGVGNDGSLGRQPNTALSKLLGFHTEELRHVAEFIVSGGDQFFQRLLLQFSQMLLQRGIERSEERRVGKESRS